jgi:hypothetical protein
MRFQGGPRKQMVPPALSGEYPSLTKCKNTSDFGQNRRGISAILANVGTLAPAVRPVLGSPKRATSC